MWTTLAVPSWAYARSRIRRKRSRWAEPVASRLVVSCSSPRALMQHHRPHLDLVSAGACIDMSLAGMQRHRSYEPSRYLAPKTFLEADRERAVSIRP